MRETSPYRYHVEVYLTDGKRYAPVAGIKRTRGGIYVRFPFDDWRQHMSYHRSGKKHFRTVVWERRGVFKQYKARIETANLGVGQPLDKLTTSIQIGDFSLIRNLSRLSRIGRKNFKPDPDAHHFVFSTSLLAGQLFHVDPFVSPAGDFTALKRVFQFAERQEGVIYLYTLGAPWLSLVFFGGP